MTAQRNIERQIGRKVAGFERGECKLNALTCRAVMMSKLRRAGSALSDGAITAQRNERYVRRSLYDKGTYPLHHIGSNKEVVSAIDSGNKRGWQVREEGHTIIMGDGLFGHLGSEMVGKDLEGATLGTVAEFTNADCLNVVRDGKIFGCTTASSATATGRRSSSPRWWGTATAAASGCGRGTRRHGRIQSVAVGCWVWQVSAQADEGREYKVQGIKYKHAQNQVQIKRKTEKRERTTPSWLEVWPWVWSTKGL